MTTNGHSTAKPTLTRLAARRINEIATGQIPDEVYRKASYCLIDYLGAVHSGLLLPWKDALLKYAKLNAGKSEAYAWGVNGEVSAETAAFVNATLAHR
jgi:2-methylcitrate dehydratase PrpD